MENTGAIHKRTVFIFLSLVGLLVYVNSLNVPLHYEDLGYLKGNPAVRSISSIGDPVANHHSNILTSRPFLLLTFALNYRLGGLDTLSYHVLNLLIHVVNAFLLYLLLYNHAGEGTSKGWSPKYVLAAVLFLIHPLNTESVAYLSGRSSELSAFFVLASMNLFFKATNNRFYPGSYLASVLFFLLGVATQEAAIVLPALLVLFDYFFISKSKENLLSRFRYYIPYLLLGCLSILSVSYLTTPSLETARTWTTHILTEIKVLPEYAKLLLLPFKLNIDHDVRSSTSMDSGVVFSLLILIALITTAALLRKRAPVVSFSILWFFAAMVPFFAVRQNDFMAERWAYTASLGFSIGLAELLFLALNRYKQAGIVLIGLVVISSGMLTIMRNNVYASPVLLWTDVAAKSPEKYRPYTNLSNAYRESGNLEKAVENSRTGIRKGKARGLTDGDMMAEYVNLAAALEEMGDFNQAEAVLKSIEQYASGSYDYYVTLGSLYVRSGKYENALLSLNTALEIYPDSPSALFISGECYEHLSQKKKARDYFLLASRKTAANASEYMGKCTSLLKLDSGNAAVKCFAGAVRNNPLDVKVRMALATILLENGYYDGAYTHFSATASIAPDFSPAYRGMGRAMLKKGDLKEASKYFMKAMYLLPAGSPQQKELLELLTKARG